MAKFIKCPDCGHVFKSPAVDIKRIGFGFTVPGLGVIRCPECKTEKRRKLFPLSTEEEANVSSGTSKSHATTPEPSEKDLIEESKYDDE